MRKATAAAATIFIFSVAGLSAAKEPAWVRLPPSSEYERAEWSVSAGGQWGRPEVIRAIRLVAHVWDSRHPDGPVIGVNDISLRGGGEFMVGEHRRHLGHRYGVEADIVTSGPYITWTHYPNQDLTLELAELFGRYGAVRILYTGKYLGQKRPDLVHYYPGHSDHFHVKFDPSKCPVEILPEDQQAGIRPLFSPFVPGTIAGVATATPSDTTGIAGVVAGRANDVRPTIRQGAAGWTVRDLQQRLGRAGFPVEIDGDFGPETDAAVRAYQTSKGLRADGVVGPDTWRKILAGP